MKKQTTDQAFETLYKNLYQSDLKHLNKNLNKLLKAKRTLVINQQDQDLLEK